MLSKGIRQLAIGNHLCLVSAVMLAVIDEMGTGYLLYPVGGDAVSLWPISLKVPYGQEL